MKQTARRTKPARRRSGFLRTFQKNLPLTIMALPALVVMFLFRYLPMSGLLLAFKRFSVRKGIFGSDWVALQNFEFLFKTSDAWVITRNTILYNALFIVMDLILAVAMAIGLSELLRKRRAKIYQTVFMAPYFLSWVVVSFMAFSLFSVDDGLFNHLLTGAGILDRVFSFLGDPRTALACVILILFTTSIGQPIVLYVAALGNVDSSMVEAASVDGASRMQIFWRIKWPAIMPTTLYVVVITTINSFQCFALIQLLTSGGPDYATSTVMYYLYETAFQQYQYGYADAMGVVLAIVIALFSALQFKVMNGGTTE